MSDLGTAQATAAITTFPRVQLTIAQILRSLSSCLLSSMSLTTSRGTSTTCLFAPLPPVAARGASPFVFPAASVLVCLRGGGDVDA